MLNHQPRSPPAETASLAPRSYQSGAPTSREVPMPNLPRLRRGARGAVARPPEQPETPNVETLEAHGLRWINIERPRPIDRMWMEEHYDFHPLDYEDVFSRNQRPKVDEYEDYLFVVLHFPKFDKQVGRLNAAELD